MVWLDIAGLRGRGWKFWTIFGGALLFVAAVVWTGPRFPASEDGMELLFYTSIGFAAGLYFFMSGFDAMKKRNLVKNTPTSRVQSIAMGMVELFGEAVPVEEDDLLQSPFSGKDCVYYRYEVEEYRSHGKHSSWDTIDAGTDSTSFYLQDDTGKVLVDPREAELKIPKDQEIHVDGGDKPPEEIQAFIERHPDVDSEDKELDMELFEMSYGNQRRYREYYVEPDKEVYVFGKAMERPGFKGSATNEENVVINKDKETPMFLISDKSEKELLSTMAGTVHLKLWGGAGLAIACFTAILFLVGLL